MHINTKKVAVYCGSSNRVDQSYIQLAFDVGRQLAIKRIGVVYGGGNVGLMKAVADGALSEHGEVIGVIPKSLETLELAHPNLTKLFVTQGMHERKALMAQLADGFIGLPGGYGTVEEVMEVITWNQINVHAKPVGLLNTKGFYDGIIQWVDHAVKEGFVRPAHRGLLSSADHLEDLLYKMEQTKFVDLSSQL
jgi:uncharacterized protein (TIGR00730 family)